MNARDIYIKVTRKNGDSNINHHRVWDAERFATAQKDQARKESQKDPNLAYSISVVSEAEYKQARK